MHINYFYKNHMTKKITNIIIKITSKKLAASSLWSILIIYLSLGRMPSAKELPFEIPFLDKIVHLTMYFILSTLLLFEFRLSTFSKRNQIIIAYTILFGLSMEVFQSYLFTYRSGSYSDLLFNIMGSTLAYILFKYYSKTREI